MSGAPQSTTSRDAKSTDTYESGEQNCLLFTPTASARKRATLWLVVMTYDVAVFAMTLYKTFGAIRDPHMPLTHLLLRDGALYFGTASLFTLANVVSHYKLGPYFGEIFIPIGLSVSVVLASRMLLNLREEALVCSNISEGDIHLSTISWAAATRSEA
ncbi:hypothetical protein EV714DRAFT_277412 [Schizophyllum commune]